MFPTLFVSEYLTIPIFFTLVTVGILVVTFFLYFRAPKLGFSQIVVLDLGIFGAIFGVFGALIGGLFALIALPFKILFGSWDGFDGASSGSCSWTENDAASSFVPPPVLVKGRTTHFRSFFLCYDHTAWA